MDITLFVKDINESIIFTPTKEALNLLLDWHESINDVKEAFKESVDSELAILGLL